MIVAAIAVNARGVEIEGVVWAERNVGANSVEETGDIFSWEEARTACPEGWRLPTRKELESLVASGGRYAKVRRAGGRWFGEGDNVIFLPGAGYRLKTGPGWSEKPSGRNNGYYWSSTAEGDEHGVNLYFDRAHAGMTNGWDRDLGMSVRCVCN